MATNLTRFEIVLPNVDTGSAADNAIQQFLTNMKTLCQLVMYTAYIYPQAGGLTQQNVLYGLITTAQQATALGYLNTLNAALGSNVLCTINAVTQEP
jgi:ketopantoate hydroxymethyltransferase